MEKKYIDWLEENISTLEEKFDTIYLLNKEDPIVANKIWMDFTNREYKKYMEEIEDSLTPEEYERLYGEDINYDKYREDNIIHEYKLVEWEGEYGIII